MEEIGGGVRMGKVTRVTRATSGIGKDAGSPIRIPVGVEAETFVPMAKQLSDEAFEAKVKETFGL